MPQKYGKGQRLLSDHGLAAEQSRKRFVESFVGDTLKKRRAERRARYESQTSVFSDVPDYLPAIPLSHPQRSSDSNTIPVPRIGPLPVIKSSSSSSKSYTHLSGQSGSFLRTTPRRETTLSSNSTESADVDSYDSRRVSTRRSGDYLGAGSKSDKRQTSRTEQEKDLGSITEVQEGGSTHRGDSYRTQQRLLRRRLLGAKFRRLAHFLTILFSLWRNHAARVRDFLENNIDLIDIGLPTDLMFDVTEFRADKQARVSQDTKRILMKAPEERTKEEVRYVQIALGNYQSIAEYPLNMTKLMAQRAWYERYEPKRIVIRQGHNSRCFYFILNGSVVVSRKEKADVSKTICFLSRGESFGELGLISNGPRQATIVSKETVELLVFGDEDYNEIFMSGGLRDPSNPFLVSLPCLDGWPLHMLGDTPSMALLTYFKRGTPLVYDSKYSDWLFIIKSGSCKVLKKLKNVQPSETVLPQEKRRRFLHLDAPKPELDTDQPHEASLEVHLAEAEAKWQDRSHAFRQRMLIELDLQIELHPLDGVNVQDTLQIVEDANKLSPSPIPGSQHPGYSVRDRRGSNLAGPFITKTNHRHRPPTVVEEETQGNVATESTAKPSPVKSKKTKAAAASSRQKAKTEHKTLVDELNDAYLSAVIHPTEADLDPVFVRVQTLTKGNVFGLSELFHDDQPALSLVSNGAECILVNKKFYLENAPKQLLSKLRMSVSPYPTESEMQEFLQIYVDWEHNKTRVFNDAMMWNEVKNMNIHDSRSTLKLRHKAS